MMVRFFATLRAGSTAGRWLSYITSFMLNKNIEVGSVCQTLMNFDKIGSRRVGSSKSEMSL